MQRENITSDNRVAQGEKIDMVNDAAGEDDDGKKSACACGRIHVGMLL